MGRWKRDLYFLCLLENFKSFGHQKRTTAINFTESNILGNLMDELIEWVAFPLIK